jgi:hypothetical protein
MLLIILNKAFAAKDVESNYIRFSFKLSLFRVLSKRARIFIFIIRFVRQPVFNVEGCLNYKILIILQKLSISEH